MNLLVIDVGGTNVKLWRTGAPDKLKFPSGKTLTPKKLVAEVCDLVDVAAVDRISLGYPGEVVHGRPVHDPYNLAPGWIDFDFERAFDRPVRLMNDASMQALGSYDGGRMLFLGLGTSVGTVFVTDGRIVPLALGHLLSTPERNFEERLNRAALERDGRRRWSRAVCETAEVLRRAFLADYVMLGGGNAKKLHELPEFCRRGGNFRAYIGGLRMWDDALHWDDYSSLRRQTLDDELRATAVTP